MLSSENNKYFVFSSYHFITFGKNMQNNANLNKLRHIYFPDCNDTMYFVL